MFKNLTLKLIPFVLLLLLAACAQAAPGEPTSTPCPTPEPNKPVKICSPAELEATRQAETAGSALSAGMDGLGQGGGIGAPQGPAGPEVPAQAVTGTAVEAAPGPTSTAAPTATLVPLPSPTACPPGFCSYAGPLFLQRPIAAPGNDSVDVTYRFGSTQGGMRDPHHGVELLNKFGTPVLAAGDGIVVVAGQDNQPTSERGVWPITYYGLYSNFYGNLVVIEHTLPPGLAQAIPEMPLPFYTLYGHLSEISVEVGQSVTAGQEIGKVGQAGIATGPHLHFEVRLGENTYASSRNPEVWLQTHKGENGQLNGALAVSVRGFQDEVVPVSEIVLQHLPDGPQQPKDFEVYVTSYEEKIVLGQAPWFESFAAGDLPPGLYSVTFAYQGLQQIMVQVYPGQISVVTFRPQ